MRYIYVNAFKSVFIDNLDLGCLTKIFNDTFTDVCVRFIYGKYVETIEDGAFSHCIILESIHFPNIQSLGEIFIDNLRILTFSDSLSLNLLNLNFKSATFGPKLKLIPDNLFLPIPNLQEIHGTEGVKSVLRYSFPNTRKLKSIDLSSCEYIGECAFINSGIRVIKLSNALNCVGSEAFKHVENSLFRRFKVKDCGGFSEHFPNIKISEKYNDAFINCTVI